MTEYERKFIVNPFLKENCKTEREQWYKLFKNPFIFMQNFYHELNFLLDWIKRLENDQSSKDALEDRLIIANYTFSDIEFMEKLATMLVRWGKLNSQRLLYHVVWMRENIGDAMSYFREHRTALHLNKEIIKSFTYMYVMLDMLYSSAFVDIMQQESDKECEFENLCNWVKSHKRWEVRYRSFLREISEKTK